MDWSAWSAAHGPLLLILAGTACLFVAVRAIAGVLAPMSRSAPGWRALVHALPTAAVAWWAAGRGQAELVWAVVLASCIGAITLGAGSATASGEAVPSDRDRRVWPFPSMLAIVVLLIGLRGELTLTTAAMLGAIGLAMLLVWRQPMEIGSRTRPPAFDKPVPFWVGHVIPLALGVALAGVGGWLAVEGARVIGVAEHAFAPGIIGAGLLAPLLTLPTIGPSSALAKAGRSSEAVATAIGVVLINLGLVLPLALVAWAGVPAVVGRPMLAARAATLPFGLSVWRLDGFALLAAAMPLLPAGFGRWRLGRGDGVGWIVGYAAFLAALGWVGVRGR